MQAARAWLVRAYEVHTVDVRAILLVGGSEDEFERESFAGLPLALQDVLGKPAVLRAIERLQTQRLNGVCVVSRAARPAGIPANVPWMHAVNGNFWRSAENAFNELSQAGAEALLVLRMGGYGEFVVDDFVQRHLDCRAHVTRAIDRNGEPLDMFMLAGSRRNDAAYLFRHELRQTRAACGHWIFEGYWNPLATGTDLRKLAIDGLMQRCEMKPMGVEQRPGIWIARNARVDRRARVLAPAYIGEHARVRGNVVVTRCSTIERYAEVEAGTVVENASVLPYTVIGQSLDIAHSIAGGRKLLHLGRKVEVEITDPKLMDARTQHAPLRAMASAAALASFLPVQFFRGLLAKSHREQPAELPDAVKASSAVKTPAGFEGEEPSAFPANLAVARRYGDQ